MDDRTADGAGGPGARPESPRVGAAAGELVTETLDYDGGRQVTVYVPPVPPEAVVFAGDGQLIPQWSASLEAADVPATMLAGVHRLPDEMQRRERRRTEPRGAEVSRPLLSARRRSCLDESRCRP